MAVVAQNDYFTFHIGWSNTKHDITWLICWVHQYLSLNVPSHTLRSKKDTASKSNIRDANRNQTHMYVMSEYMIIYDLCIYIYIYHEIHDIICIQLVDFPTGRRGQLDHSPIKDLRSSFEHEPSRDDFCPGFSWKYTMFQVGICLPLESWRPKKKKFLKIFG